MSPLSRKIQFDHLDVAAGGAVVLCLAYLVAFLLLRRRYGLSEVFKRHISYFAPAFLIFAPPIITYGVVDGLLSLGFGLLCDTFFSGKISNREAFFLPVFKGVEYLSGVGMGYVWMRFARWLGLKAPWYLFILASLGLVAGYREARSDYGGNAFGPTVTEHFIVVDALIPFLALLFYGLLHLRKRAI
jgi:hypothetical protein